MDALERVRRGACDPLPRGDAASQRDHCDVGVRDDARADRIAGAGDHVQDARWEDLGGELGEPQRAQRGDLRRLEHDHVPRGERRRDLPDRHHQGVVPGRDLADDADRFAAHERRVAGLVLPRGRGVRRSRRTGEESELIRADRQLLGRQRTRLADVGRLERRQLAGVAVDRVGERQQRLHSPTGRRVTPAEPCGPGRAHCAIDVGLRALGHAADRLPVRRIDDFAGAAVDGVDELTRNQIAEHAHLRERGHRATSASPAWSRRVRSSPVAASSSSSSGARTGPVVSPTSRQAVLTAAE